MATSTDAARVIHGLTKKAAEQITRAPTGIEPGFDPETGIAWTEDGRARYRGNGNRALAICKFSGGVNITHSTVILNFDSVLHDPNGQVTTGASWIFTATYAGWYQIIVSLSMETQAGWGTGFSTSTTLRAIFDDTSTLGLASGVLWLDHQYPRDGDNNIQVFLQGSAIGYLAVGDTLYTDAVQHSLTTPLVAAAARSRLSILRV